MKEVKRTRLVAETGHTGTIALERWTHIVRQAGMTGRCSTVGSFRPHQDHCQTDEYFFPRALSRDRGPWTRLNARRTTACSKALPQTASAGTHTA